MLARKNRHAVACREQLQPPSPPLLAAHPAPPPYVAAARGALSPFPPPPCERTRDLFCYLAAFQHRGFFAGVMEEKIARQLTALLACTGHEAPRWVEVGTAVAVPCAGLAMPTPTLVTCVEPSRGFNLCAQKSPLVLHRVQVTEPGDVLCVADTETVTARLAHALYDRMLAEACLGGASPVLSPPCVHTCQADLEGPGVPLDTRILYHCSLHVVL